MSGKKSDCIRLEIRFFQAVDSDLYQHLTRLSPRHRAEFLRHLAGIGWLVHRHRRSGETLPNAQPERAQGPVSPDPGVNPLDVELLGSLQDFED